LICVQSVSRQVKTPGYVAPSPIERRPSSPRKFSGQIIPDRQPSPVSPTPTDPLQHVTTELAKMQEDIRKRDTLIQELYKHIQSPSSRPAETNIAQQLADAKREIEQLKESTSQLKQSQQDISLALNTPEKMPPSVSTHRVRERVGKWQEFLETPISVSQRRSRQTPRQSSKYTIFFVFRGLIL